MKPEQIETFLNGKAKAENSYVKIDFKTRESIYGLFITETPDYRDLSSKNFWRVVTRKHFDQFSKSKDINLARLFNGSEFTKLSLLNDGF